VELPTFKKGENWKETTNFISYNMHVNKFKLQFITQYQALYIYTVT